MTLLFVLALTVVGLLVGVELCVAVFVNPILDRLPGADGLLGRADGARVLGRVMPFWYAASVALVVVLAVLSGTGRAALVTAAVLLALSVLLSVALLVPINDRAKTWGAEGAPADWRDQLHRWDRLHVARVGLIGVGFVSLAFGVLQAA